MEPESVFFIAVITIQYSVISVHMKKYRVSQTETFLQ